MASWDVGAWADAVCPPGAPFAFDCLLVLAGGVDDATGAVHASVARRLDAAAELYRRSGGAVAIIANGGGTAHKPRWRDAAGFAVPEAQLMATQLAARGVPLSAITLEALSDDTIGNAFCARALHTEWRPTWRRLLLITSDFQLPRAEAVYRWVYGLTPPPPGPPYALRAAGVPDEGAVGAEALAARCAREAASLESFGRGAAAALRSMEAAHAWLFAQHGAYAPRAAPREAVDPALLATY